MSFSSSSVSSGFQNSLCPGDHDVIAARVHFVLFQRTRRWTTDVFSAQVVLPVMTGTPNLFRVVAVLHDALEVRAHSRKGFELARRRVHQDARFVSELENFS